MARISGVDLPREKRVEIGLTYIYGIGKPRAQAILTAAGVDFDTRVKDLTEAELAKIREEIDKYHVEGDLRRDVAMNIKRLREINCYRGRKQKTTGSRRRVRKNIEKGEAHIASTFNNTMVTLTDVNGNVISWASAGQLGFRGSRKSTPFAAQEAAQEAAEKAKEHGLKSVDVYVKEEKLQLDLSKHQVLK